MAKSKLLTYYSIDFINLFHLCEKCVIKEVKHLITFIYLITFKFGIIDSIAFVIKIHIMFIFDMNSPLKNRLSL